MKKLLILAALLAPSVAYAGDDAFDCNRKNGDIECKVKKERVSVKAITLDGGDCNVPQKNKVYGKPMKKDDKFALPGQSDCNYVRAFTITTADGKTQVFDAF